MKSFRRGAFLVASTNSVQDGLEAIIVSYLRIILSGGFYQVLFDAETCRRE